MTPTPDELRAKAEELACMQHPGARGVHRLSSPAYPDERLLEAVPISRARVLSVTVIERPRRGFEPLYFFRHWNIGPTSFSPTPNCISVMPDQLPFLAVAIAKAMEHEMARLPGWATDDGSRPPAVSNGAAPSTPAAPDTREA